ncbi:hypothetical protein B9Q01_01640 [Candidatus Marsarchaeota G1 archaeon OSP_D]|jgi:hypothetical protein|nr:MAG: hypothetical protein B9Q01_01640 [Candidatus Marsarchaeota G1 archaeon OSP_D]PSN85859.1 MAG: hypothetical protein B9Q02_04730 [Candidatus Marsarchaeota G1 archaeon BE_D]PSN89361.1 MAG: hypothetical protein B9Q00_01740 [Candidatus Marsarchaeota G1 archaeon OSP_C]
MKFDKLFKQAVEAAFSNFGVVGQLMIKDIENRMGKSYSSWWKKPEELSKVLDSIYGSGARSIERVILKELASLSGYDLPFDTNFSEALRKIKEHVERS